MKRVLSLLIASVMLMTTILGFSSCGNEGKNLKVDILPVKGGASGIITIVHDDGDLTTARFLYEQFDLYGLKGTFAMIADKVVDVNGNLTANAAEWQELVASGYFDIANHTQSHTWYGFTDEGGKGQYEKNNGTLVDYDYAPGRITSEVVGAAERMREVFPGQKILSYVIPGFTNTAEYNGRTPEAIKIINDNFLCQRNTGGSAKINGENIPYMNDLKRLNYDQLNSYMVRYSDDWENDWFDYVDNAINYSGWGIYCFHNIWEVEQPTKGHNVAQSKAAALIEYIAEKTYDGSIWCATLDEGLLYTKEYAKARAEISYAEGKVSVVLRDFLDNEIYDMALTVRIDVPKSWERATFTYDGKSESYTTITRDDGTKYIELDMIPDRGTAEIVEG